MNAEAVLANTITTETTRAVAAESVLTANVVSINTTLAEILAPTPSGQGFDSSGYYGRFVGESGSADSILQ